MVVVSSISHILLQTGEALTRIHDLKLYMSIGCRTFRQYITNNRCRFGFDYKKAEKIVKCTKLVQLLHKNDDVPCSLLHIAPLAHLPERLVASCWREIVTACGGTENVSVSKATATVRKYMSGSFEDDTWALGVPSGNDKHHDNNWYTPYEPILSRVNSVFQGGIDLDPCSDEHAQKTVCATKFYTVQDDGLSSENKWFGKVFLNPPYCLAEVNKGMQEMFLERAIAEVNKGNVQECILLLKASPGARWFESAFTQTSLGWLKSRLRFESRLGDSGKAPFGSVIAYIGPNESRFVEAFKDVAFFPGANAWSYKAGTA